MKKYQINFLEWDSKFFNKIIYRIDILIPVPIDEIEFILNDLKADLLYIFSKQNLYGSLSNNCLLVDKKVIFCKQLKKMENYLSDENIISSFKCSKYLLNLAILSGKFSRFNVDRILRPKFEILYHTWLEKSVKREIADEVYSYIIDGKEIAFVTVKRTNEKALIGLIAVDSEYHGKKLGSKLIMVVEKWCMDNHIEILEVATQYNNSQACHFYKKNEFTIKQIDYVYHMYKK